MLSQRGGPITFSDGRERDIRPREQGFGFRASTSRIPSASTGKRVLCALHLEAFWAQARDAVSQELDAGMQSGLSETISDRGERDRRAAP